MNAEKSYPSGKINIGALWMIASILLPFIAAGIIEGMGGDDTPIRLGVISIVLLLIAIGIRLILARKTVMNGVEMACYWLGLSFALVLFLIILFKLVHGNELIGIIMGLLISLSSCAILIYKRREKLLRLEIALYWLGLSCAVTGFLATLLHLANFSRGAVVGAIIGAVISFLSGIFVIYLIIKRKRT